MISAAEALRLPSARLTEEEQRAADALVASIDTAIRGGYARGTIECQIRETRTKVVDEVQQRIRKAGWTIQTFPIQDQALLSGSGQKRTVGYGLVLSPNEQAYEAADQRGAN